MLAGEKSYPAAVMKTAGKILSFTLVFFFSFTVLAEVPRFLAPPIFPAPFTVTGSVLTADFNNDGLPDIATSEEQDRLGGRRAAE